jgi:hypothetical protein
VSVVSLLAEGDLTATERRLCEAAAEGRLLDLSTRPCTITRGQSLRQC